MPKASLLMEEAGRDVISRQPDRPMIPASTMKIVTALRAIQAGVSITGSAPTST